MFEQAQPVGAKDRTETVDPFELQDQLLELAEVRRSWDELFGRLALLLKGLGLWRDLGFASFSHYAVERLGMAGRTVSQRAWLERRLLYLPELRKALSRPRVRKSPLGGASSQGQNRGLLDWDGAG